ncbi:hypothetical protein [Paenarthrobacter sp. YJN-5]|uniref:hypothetical protein n=1 Tax=Paenarthrobacter sp. YJN-5 TaxID=2735316 RepID=UPI00187768E5|nr:hypothetical protein [Paenarthrobacter sp. YJN-5]QOT19370.1 hypothetical protein HMI59_22205 [Paenarthrobacter sp. YJN-5]
MIPKSSEHVLTTFTPNQWAGRPAKDSGYLFFGVGFLTWLVCLVLMIFIEPLRNFGIMVLVCTLSATLFTIASIVTTVKSDRAFLSGLTETLNEQILEMTGDPSARITSSRLRQMIDLGFSHSLTINGVPGLDLKVAGERFKERQVIATVTAPDYGLESFDLLLRSEEEQSKL